MPCCRLSYASLDALVRVDRTAPEVWGWCAAHAGQEAYSASCHRLGLIALVRPFVVRRPWTPRRAGAGSMWRPQAAQRWSSRRSNLTQPTPYAQQVQQWAARGLLHLLHLPLHGACCTCCAGRCRRRLCVSRPMHRLSCAGSLDPPSPRRSARCGGRSARRAAAATDIRRAP